MRARPLSQEITWAPPSWIDEIYLFHFFSLLTNFHLLALWYWYNMHIKLLSFKMRCLSQWFWAISVLNLNLLQQVEMWLCHVYFSQLCMCITSFLKQEISPEEDLTSLAQITGTTSKHQSYKWPELYRMLIVFLDIVMWHISVNSLLEVMWLECSLSPVMWQKQISMPNFETYLHQNVTANKRICNMHFMYLVMAWFKSL